jgi:aminopeptidase YwaD
MTKLLLSAAAAAMSLSLASASTAQAETPWTVKPEWVAAHEAFLASDAANGRGSATHDEAVAAAYVASEFQGYGLKTAPGMDGYLQRATIVKLRFNGTPTATIDGKTVGDADGLKVFISPGTAIAGTVQMAPSDPQAMSGDVVAVSDPGKTLAQNWMRAASAKGVKLLILRESDQTAELWGRLNKGTRLPTYLEDQGPPKHAGATVIVLGAAAFDALKAGASFTLNLPEVVQDKMVTTNAVAFLQGSDPKAGAVLYTAHLDHFPPRPDGSIMHGANDDASGTTAVLEIAHALANSGQPRRSIIFVCYGSEELGGFGSQYFAAHPPVPLTSIVANLEFEMIGAQDPKLPANTLMMTGFERSNLGEALKAHGALVAADPYPDQHFFERSDNYSLAVTGVVAHTLSGWAVVPTYHTPQDTLANLNLPFMTQAIQSLIEPARWLANSDFTPQWKPGGQPTR